MMTHKSNPLRFTPFTPFARYRLLALAFTGGIILAGGSGHAAEMEASLPPEVKALIGLKVPPEVAGKKTPRIPNFTSRGGAIGFGIDKKRCPGQSGYKEGVVGGRWPVFLIDCIYPDLSVEILDAQTFPENLLEWRFEGGKFQYTKDRFRFSDACRASEAENRRIFGLVKPEEGKADCAHFSNRVERAWLIDKRSGRITPLAPKGLQCHYETMSSCY